MAASSVSLSWVSSTVSNKLSVPCSTELHRSSVVVSSSCSTITCSRDTICNDEGNCSRRILLSGVGLLAANLIPANSVFAEEIPKNYHAFVDRKDGYSYVYPSDWREFDFRGHDSAFKDRYLQLQNVRLSFIPTTKTDVHDLGPMEEVITNLVKDIYAAPNQVATIFDMQERTVDGKNYYTFEYDLTSRNFSRTAFATIAIGNGTDRRYYTLKVGANERRWRRVRDKLKVVADSFKVLDI